MPSNYLILCHPLFLLASLVAQRLKRLPAMREMWVWSLGWEDPLEKEMATHSSILTWRILWMEEPGGLQSIVHWTGDAIQLSHPLFLLPSIFASFRVFSKESALCIGWPKYWSFSFSINPSNEYSGLIYFRIDWLDLLDIQGTLKSLIQHHSLKASIPQC